MNMYFKTNLIWTLSAECDFLPKTHLICFQPVSVFKSIYFIRSTEWKKQPRMHLFLPCDSSSKTRESPWSLVFSTVPVGQVNWRAVIAGVHMALQPTEAQRGVCFKHLQNCFWPHFLTFGFSREEARVPERCEVGRLCFCWNHVACDPAQRSSGGWWPSWG